jgi:NAD(P)-dependent dehydrogenase (short-subunit alcohol dehydrogenase family)
LKVDLTGKVAVVTGASKGIGRAIAERLALSGAKVCVSSRNLKACEAVRDSIVKSQGTAIAVAADTSDPQALSYLVDETIEKFGTIDILVNNAATSPIFGPVEETSEAGFDKIMAVNVRGPFTLSKLILPHFKKKNSGSIINIGSIGAVRPEEALGIYSMSKAALLSLTKVLAKEWGPYGVRVNCVCPGLVKTKFNESVWESPPNRVDHFLMRTPMKRIATPEEIAPFVVFLASDSMSGFSTGGVFTIDSGMTL